MKIHFDILRDIYNLYLNFQHHLQIVKSFIPPLMSRATQPTITNKFYDQPLVCANQLHYEGPWEFPKLGQLH